MAIKAIFAGKTWFPGIGNVNTSDRQELLEVLSRVKLLTPKQFEVLESLGRGFSNREIGNLMKISDSTVAFHMRAIFKKLNVYTRTQALLVYGEIAYGSNKPLTK